MIKYFIILWICGFIYVYADFLDCYTYLKKISKSREKNINESDTDVSDIEINKIRNIIVDTNVFIVMFVLFIVWPHYFYTTIYKNRK